MVHRRARLTSVEVFQLATWLKESQDLPYNTWSALSRDASKAIGRTIGQPHLVTAGNCVGLDSAALVKEKTGHFSTMVFNRIEELTTRIAALEKAIGSIEG